MPPVTTGRGRPEGGPGNLERWIGKTGATFAPLLFIETIPSRETRFFIGNVMASDGICRLRLDQTTPTLDMVAAGSWPTCDQEEQQHAGN